MKKLSNSNLLKTLTTLLVLLFIAKALAVVAWWYLPSESVELQVKNNYQPQYKRYDFKNMITRSTSSSQTQTKQDTTSGISITNMVLKGLYGTPKKGFVIVAMRSNPKKTQIIAIGEQYKGYTLKSITPSSAIFEKNKKDYVLEFEKPKKSNAISKVKKNRYHDEDIQREVNRQDIEYFAKNPAKIWKDISIVEVKEGKKIKGFKIIKIKPNSKFAALGLERGDVIIKANNVTLESYRDAIEIYKNIGKLDTVQIVVKRNNQEKEFVYEIN